MTLWQEKEFAATTNNQSVCQLCSRGLLLLISQSINIFCRKSVEKVLFVTSGQPHSSCFDYKFDLNSIAPTAGKRTRPFTRLLQQTLSWGVRSSSLKMWYPPCPSCSLDLWLTYNSPPGVAGFCLLSHTLELPSEDTLSLSLSLPTALMLLLCFGLSISSFCCLQGLMWKPDSLPSDPVLLQVCLGFLLFLIFGASSEGLTLFPLITYSSRCVCVFLSFSSLERHLKAWLFPLTMYSPRIVWVPPLSLTLEASSEDLTLFPPTMYSSRCVWVFLPFP